MRDGMIEKTSRWLAFRSFVPNVPHKEYVMASQLSARHWMDGDWVESEERTQSTNPANGETIGTYINSCSRLAAR